MNASRGSRVAVVGIGNVLMHDDGLGHHVVEALDAETAEREFDVWDFGTASMDLLGTFLDYRKVIVVDAINGGSAPGTVYRLLSETLSAGAGRVSAHDAGLAEVISIADYLGASPEVVIYGIEPAEIRPAIGLSEPVRTSLARLIDLVRHEAVRGSPPWDEVVATPSCPGGVGP